METITNSLSEGKVASQWAAVAKLSDYIQLTKPRVMMLAVFTALVGLNVAPRELDQFRAFLAVLAIAAGAGGAGALNMWYDADIDAVMARTGERPIPSGRVSRREAITLGLSLSVASVALLAFAANLVAASLLACAIFYYVVVYTVWLKRITSHNIVIGGAAGALPPVIGWAASTGRLDAEPVVLFLIIFLWTPPHFWALAHNRADEYAKARVPMLPVVSGREATRRWILFYSALLVPVSALPVVLRFAGAIYAVTALVCGVILVDLALQLAGNGGDGRQAARRLFLFSIGYLFLLFTALLIDHDGGLGGRAPESRGAQGGGVVNVNLSLREVTRVLGSSDGGTRGL